MMIKVFTAFSGYDSQCLALDRIKANYPQFDYELVGWSEIEPGAIVAHNAIYPQYADRNFGDITKIDWSSVGNVDLFTYSSPCQDFSSAGLHRGGAEGSSTRSSLLWNCYQAIEIMRPKYLLMENVSALVGKKFIKTFHAWQKRLADLGYSNFAQILNAKDFGVPQNRERIIMISVMGKTFHFPNKMKLDKTLFDVLEADVDSSYWLTKKRLAAYYEYNERQRANGTGFKFEVKERADIGRTVTTLPDRIGGGQLHQTAMGGGIARTITTQSDRSDTNYIRQSWGVRLSIHESPVRGGGITDSQTSRIYDTKGIAPTLCRFDDPVKIAETSEISDVRKLTPRESFRLMGVDDATIDKIYSAGLSKTAMYRLAGNSIVVDVLYHVFRKMFVETENENQQLTLWN